MTFPYIRPYNIYCGVDNTPNQLIWADITWDAGAFPQQGGITSQQITGITSGIYIQIQPGTGNTPTLYYQISANQITGTIASQPVSPWTSATSNTTVIVSGNQWLSFTCHSDSFQEIQRTATIINLSDGNKTLDSFFYSNTGATP